MEPSLYQGSGKQRFGVNHPPDAWPWTTKTMKDASATKLPSMRNIMLGLLIEALIGRDLRSAKSHRPTTQGACRRR